MSLVLLLALTSLIEAADAPAATNQLTAAEIGAGWVRLFDGNSMFGWSANNDVNWQVHEGTLQADTGKPGLLLTDVPFADFELRCDFHLEKGGNSGIFLRTPRNPKDPANDCYELNICDSHPNFGTGSLVGRQRPDTPVTGEGDWHRFHVTASGNKVVVAVDGKSVLTYLDQRPTPLKSGHIGLQKNAGKVQFRNIFLRPIGGQPLFNGKNLTGWHEVPGGKSDFKVTDGTIHVTNGAGFLETDGTWADFILQAQVRTNGPNLNSGIFFRAIPGTAKAPSNGYECQIHNAFKDGDRTKPVDFGTGAIYRRVAARKVVSSDNEWTTLTLAAAGPRIAVWVNGELVTDWVDTRKPHENPRKGLRLEAGYLSLQGHDPTTDLSFRNMTMFALP